MDPVQNKAFEWACDYKPWQEDLPPQDYARYGFEQGYKQAVRDFKAVMRDAGMLDKFKEFLDNPLPDASVE